MKILRDQHLIVFENLGSKAPGIAAFIKWLNFNMEEGDIWEEDLVFDEIYAKDGNVYIDWDPDSEYMEEDPETFPDRYLEILEKNGPKEFRMCSKNVADEIDSGDREAEWPLDRIINAGDEEAGITETPGANYEVGDENLLWAQLRSPVSESMKLREAVRILEAEGLKLQRSRTIWDYLDELEEIDPSAREMMIEELIEDSHYIVQGDDGFYYDTSIGRDSMTDDPIELIEDVTYDDLVADYGTPEEYANS